MNLDWISKLISKLPETSITRKNLIEIAGYPKWENVNSNLLAFYFDENEEHGFQRLFLNSLLDVYESKISSELQRELFETEYTVDREFSTIKGGRIDLVLKEDTQGSDNSENSSWAIIIENKTFSPLHNNLADYWESVKAESKIGIVLSVNSKKVKGKYVNILHKELVDKVLQNLPDYYLESNDLHLLFMKEYIANVNSYYRNKTNIQEMDTILQLFHENNTDIKALKKKDIELLNYISKIVTNTFEENGFSSSSKTNSSKSKHVHINGNATNLSEVIQSNINIAEKFRFYINIDRLRYNETFLAYFELRRKENTIYGDALKEALEKEELFTDNIRKGKGGKSGSGHQHILLIEFPLGDFSEIGFDTRIKEIVQNELFGKGFIDRTVLGLKKEIETKQT